MKVMVYSHDTFGLGNIRRMLAICKHLLKSIPDISILLVSGSPMIHTFRMPQGLDYIKVPCLGRNEIGELSVKYLNTETTAAIKLRSDLILAAAINFKPDLILVDKKPYALKGELKNSLNYLKKNLPNTKVVLVLRDILDSPDATIKEWNNNLYYEGLELFYDQILVLGMSEVFDVVKEYQFPQSIAKKVKYCGYIRRESGESTSHILRQRFHINTEEKLVLVTPGGGADGYRLIKNYLSSLNYLPRENKLNSLIVCGPEMPKYQQEDLSQLAGLYPQVHIQEFTDDLNSYINAADLVVSMAGYNTICEILSMNKRAVVVPRIQPGKEQWIRAERMDKLGLLKAIHPDFVTPESLLDAILGQLNSTHYSLPSITHLDLDALPRISSYVRSCLYGYEVSSQDAYFYLDSVFANSLAIAG
jgi:predicted glycosyltransferase